MRQELKEMYTRIQALHSEFFEFVQKQAQWAKDNPTEMEELADVAYMFREVSNFLNDSRRSADGVKELVERVACMCWVQSGNYDRISTDFCTALPDVKMAVRLPSKTREPEAYRAMLEYFNIDEGLCQNDAIRFHWPGMVEYVSQRLAAGEKLPETLQIREQYPVYKLKLQKRRSAQWQNEK